MEWFQRLSLVFDTVRPVLDVAILSFLLYQGYILLKRTQGLQLILGAGILGIVYGIAVLCRLATLQWVLSIMAPGLFIAVAIVFQPELRQMFMRLGQGELFRAGSKPRLGSLEAVVTAAEILSEKRRGMLVVFPRRTNLRNIMETGTRLNADISSSLIVTVFEFDTPLHDGAMVIHHGKIAAAGCFLPLSNQKDIKKSFGTRHRASLGMSEQSDAVVLVVSEETGAISLAYDAKLYYDLPAFEVTRKLKEFLETGTSGGGTEGTVITSGSALDGEDLGEAALAAAMRETAPLTAFPPAQVPAPGEGKDG
jgi:diadenylate cyclase